MFRHVRVFNTTCFHDTVVSGARDEGAKNRWLRVHHAGSQHVCYVDSRDPNNAELVYPFPERQTVVLTGIIAAALLALILALYFCLEAYGGWWRGHSRWLSLQVVLGYVVPFAVFMPMRELVCPFEFGDHVLLTFTCVFVALASALVPHLVDSYHRHAMAHVLVRWADAFHRFSRARQRPWAYEQRLLLVYTVFFGVPVGVAIPCACAPGVDAQVRDAVLAGSLLMVFLSVCLLAWFTRWLRSLRPSRVYERRREMLVLGLSSPGSAAHDHFASNEVFDPNVLREVFAYLGSPDAPDTRRKQRRLPWGPSQAPRPRT